MRAEGEGRKCAGRRLWQGGAHRACGLKVGAPGDEEVEAVELAVVRSIHEGRATGLRRRGDGDTRGQRRWQEGRAGVAQGWPTVRAVCVGEGTGGVRAAGGAALTSSAAFTLARLAMRRSRQSSSP